jgi:predicted transcriptional regulator
MSLYQFSKRTQQTPRTKGERKKIKIKIVEIVERDDVRTLMGYLHVQRSQKPEAKSKGRERERNGENVVVAVERIPPEVQWKLCPH